MAWRLLEAGFLRLEFGDSLTWSCAWSWGGVATTEDYRCLRWQATCHVATSGGGLFTASRLFTT